jgi:putative flippase GtrA
MRTVLPDRIAHHVRKLDTPAGRRMVRYVTQSVLTTLFSFLVLGLVYGVFRLWSEVPSVIFANSVATVPSYYLNRNWVWRKSGRSHLRKEVIPFWVVSFIGIVLSIFAAAAARHIGLKYFPDNHAARTVLVEAANLFSFGVLWIGKFLIFSRLFHHHQQAEESAAAAATVAGSSGTTVEASSGNGRLPTGADATANGHGERVAQSFEAQSFEEPVRPEATGIA